jgi:hypothetical protein
MIFTFKFKSCLLAAFLLISNLIVAQNQSVDKNENQLKFNVSADLVSRYVWRGTDFGDSPSIQPTLSLACGNFEIGAWGAFATNSFYKEMDLYAKYTYKSFSLAITDYYVPSLNGSPASPDTHYFIYNDTTTSHTIEGSLTYKNAGDFPFWLQANMFLYGNDKRWGYDTEKDVANDTYFSTYLEAGYSFKVQEVSSDVFIGFTPAAGAYGNTMGVVNLGLSASREISITDRFKLPVKASLIFNPQASAAYFVLGITLNQ